MAKVCVAATAAVATTFLNASINVMVIMNKAISNVLADGSQNSFVALNQKMGNK